MSSNLSTPEAYFSTELGSFDAQKHQVDGIWNLTHTSLFDPYFGGSWNFKGKTFTEIRDEIKKFMTDQRKDPQLIDMIKNLVIADIPIRSGKLADMIFKTMRIDRFIWYSVHYFSSLSYQYPDDRPLPVPGRVQHLGEKGYGEYGTYKVTDPLVLSKVSIDHISGTIPRVSSKGKIWYPPSSGHGALYNLNDPTAYADVRDSINKAFDEVIVNEMADRFNFVITVII